jgi:hypothetical protein
MARTPTTRTSRRDYAAATPFLSLSEDWFAATEDEIHQAFADHHAGRFGA